MKKVLRNVFIIILALIFLPLLFPDCGDEEKSTANEKNVNDSSQSTSESQTLTVVKPKPILTDSIWESMIGSSFRMNSDEFNKSEFYTHNLAPRYDNRNWVGTYLGKQGNIVWLRFKAQYAADNWLFIEEIKFNIDEDIVEFPVGYGAFKRDNNSGGIWEWADLSVADDGAVGILKRIANSKRTKVRYVGQQYHDDRVVSQNEKIALKKTIEVFEAAKGYR